MLIENKEASGIEYIKNGIVHRVKARKEVIVSAGSLSSPRILMLSGVGPREHLTQMGVSIKIIISI